MIETLDVPLDPALARELVDFWTYIWNEPPDVPIDVFLGSEVEHVDLTVFFERGSVGVTSTCMIVSPRAIPTIADLEVWPESHWPGFALRQADVLQVQLA